MARPFVSVRLAAIAALGATLSFASCGSGGVAGATGDGSSTDAEDRPPLVQTTVVELRSVRQIIETTSYLQSERDIPVLPLVSGRLEEVLVDEGERVEKGQVLARLDDRHARSQVRQTEVLLADRKVKLELAKLEAEAAGGRVQQAKIDRNKAKADYERNTTINAELISGQELDDSKFVLDSAEEFLKVSEFNERKAQLEVDVARSSIDELEARLDSDQLRLEEHQVLSPLSGVVAERLVRGGENVSASNSLQSLKSFLFRIIDDENLICYLRRPQRELSILRNAREVTFATDAFGDREFRATIDVLSPVIDETNGSFQVRIRVAREHTEDLRPGMFVRAKIMTEDQREALMVPKAAVVNEGDRAIVFAIRDGIAHRVVLDTGLEERDYIECKNRGDGGLAPGDAVVVSGHQNLRDQTAVDVSNG